MPSTELPGFVTYTDGNLTARVYFYETEGGRLELRRIEIDQSPLEPETVRRLPLPRLISWANGPERDVLVLMLTDPEVEITVTAGGRWLAGEYRRPRRPRLKLPGAQDRRKPGDFYERVAAIYRWLTAEGSRGPAEAIAVANDVPVTTAHRWIREARRRGILAPGRQGKAG